MDSQRDAALIHDTLRAEGVVCRLAHELANATFLLKPFTTEKLLATVNGVLHPPKLLAP